MLNWIRKIFKREPKIIDFYKDSSWMLTSDLIPNIENLKHSKEFIALKGCKQSKYFHKEGDAWKHTMLTCKHMYNLLLKNNTLSDNDKRILMIAALCHDLGKPSTTYFDEKEQTWRCKNHGFEGEKITRNLLFNEEIITREEICWLVRWHMNFHHILEKEKEEQRSEIIKLSLGQSSIEKLLLLNMADTLASKSKSDPNKKNNEVYKCVSKIAKEFNCFDKPYQGYNKNCTFTMYMMIGLPGSGKNTYIDKFLPMTPTICRDDIREELTDGEVIGRKLMLSKKGEDMVTKRVNEGIKNCCLEKKSFIINQTSLKKKYRDELKNEALKYGSPKFVYIYVEAPSIEECINRREGGKWNDIINKMWDSFEFPDKSECDELIIWKQKN